MSEYVSSCKSIEVWENLCKAAVSKGYATVKHNGKGEGINAYSVDYFINLKSSLYPIRFHFWYDRRIKDTVRKDAAAVSFTFEELMLLLQAIINKELKIDLPEFNISRMPNGRGIRIQQK